MSEFSDFFDNSVLFWSLLSCLIAQFLKIIFNFFSTGKIRFGIMFETGGMPSSHSALKTRLSFSRPKSLANLYFFFLFGIGFRVSLLSSYRCIMGNVPWVRFINLWSLHVVQRCCD